MTTDTTPAATDAYDTILVERKGRTALLTLNRPHALNALNLQVMNEVVAATEALDRDPDVGCIVLTGSAKAFAAGADIKEMRPQSYLDMYLSDWFTAWDRLGQLRTPTVAAVAGYALGGGCELAMLCDILLAADTAVFGQPEIKLGVIPGIGGSQRLTRAVGKAKAMELCLTGRTMDAAEAERAWPGLARGARRRTARRGTGGRRDRGGHVAAGRHDGEGGGRPRLRDNPRRGRPLRTPTLPRGVRHRRPEGGHERLHRQAPAPLHPPLTHAPLGRPAPPPDTALTYADRDRW